MPLPSPLLPVLVGAASLAAAVAIDAFLVEPVRIQISRHQVALPGLPEAWRGARVVHLSDLHYGDPRSEWLFRWMVRTVNALEPDLILITGDFIVRHPDEVAPAVAYVGQLRAKHGVVAILGDHDFQIFTRHPLGGIDSALQNIGLRLLRNDALTLPGGLRIAGIDPVTHKVRCGDLEAALRAEPNPHLLLSHSPDILPAAAARGVDLVLAGHTHGGQVVVPFFGPPITHTHIGRKHATGWSEYQGTRLFVCRGLASHYSLRFCCPPEVALFELTDAG